VSDGILVAPCLDLGMKGWIAVDVSRRLNQRELQPLALESYRHFALKRMLAELSAA